jgi:prophage regulatory protein
MNAQPQLTEDGANADQASAQGPAPARLLRLPEVIDRVGLRRSAIYQRMSEGRFPKSRPKEIIALSCAHGLSIPGGQSSSS